MGRSAGDQQPPFWFRASDLSLTSLPRRTANEQNARGRGGESAYFELLNTVGYYCRSRTLGLDTSYKEMNSRLPAPENVTLLMFSSEKFVASSRLVTKSTNAHETKNALC